MDVLTISGLRKHFGRREVLKDLSLHVPAHGIYGFVGRNGAGKTTTMKAILGLIRPDAGEMWVAGERVTYGQTATNRFVGYLPDVPAFYPFMTPREYLTLCGESMGMSRAAIRTRSEELLTLVGLAEENHRIKGFSRGMKQRLGIAQALLADPCLLICDEPTSALDPIGRREILDILLSVRERTTVLFSTHILSDVERICTEVAFLEDGRIALQGTVEELKRSRMIDACEITCADERTAARLAEHFPQARPIEPLLLLLPGGDGTMREAMACIAAEHLSVRRIERVEPTLEALFQEVTAS